MSDQHLSHDQWLLRLNDHLQTDRYTGGTTKRYVASVRQFLVFIEKRHIQLISVRPEEVAQFVQHAMRRFRQQYGRSPASKTWRSDRTGAIHILLRLVHGQWPLNPIPSSEVTQLQHQICAEYVQWMVETRGLAHATVSHRSREAHRFLCWLLKQSNRTELAHLTITHIDQYVKYRSSQLRRSSMSTVTYSLRAFLRWLHTTARTGRDLSTAVLGPSRYAFESIPSALAWQDVEKVLHSAQQDHTAQGIRAYAILLLLAKYGVRSGEIVKLRLDDIDWRKGVIRIGHTKTGSTSYLPLLTEVGNAILKYLQKARPKTAFREIFMRSCAPCRPLKRGGSLYDLVRSRIEAAGITTSTKRGPHTFRHARAVSLLRAAVPLKEIGDMLGHRSIDSTMTYLKLATEDLRAIALEIPAEVAA